MEKENKKMKFHITITDNETGETLCNTDACVILGAINEGERTCTLLMTDCGPFDLVDALRAAHKVTKTVGANHPEILALSLLAKRVKEREQAGESEEPETEETDNNN